MADSGNARVQVFDSQGHFVRKWGSSGAGDGQFAYPTGIATDVTDNVYVVDSNNYRIQVFNNTGTFLRKWGSLGSGDGQFTDPSGIAVDKNGNVFVTDLAVTEATGFRSSTMQVPF